jgi:hypothetical protein
MTWFRPHRHNWTLWEPITGFLGFPAGLQERNCGGCGWTQRADIERMPTPGLGIPMCEQGLVKLPAPRGGISRPQPVTFVE